MCYLGRWLGMCALRCIDTNVETTRVFGVSGFFCFDLGVTAVLIF